MKSASRLTLVAGCISLGIALGIFLSGSISQGQNPPPPILPRELTSYRDVAKQVLPAIVSIEAKAKPKRLAPRTRAADTDGIPKPSRPFIEEPDRRREAPPDDGDLGFGSGWIVDPTGIIMTNYHVVEGADHLIVSMIDGRKFSTTDFITDKKNDLALVRVQSRRPLPALQLGDSDAMEIGDRVLALGAPFGLKGSVTSGIVSAKGRNLHLDMYEDFIQTDAAVNPGSSGGPLVNLEGKVIGITSAIKSRSGGFQGVGLAVSSNLAKSVMEQLLRDGIVRRGYLGIQMDDVDPDMAARLGLRSGGVLTKKVLPKTPAADAGLKAGDIITAIAGKTVSDAHALQRIVSELPAQKPAEIIVVRNGKSVSLSVTVVPQPE